MGVRKRIIIIVVPVVLLLVGIAVGIWYQKLAHIGNDDFATRIRKSLGKSEDSFIYKRDLDKINEIFITNENQLKYVKLFPKLEDVMIENSTISVNDLNTNLKGIKKLVIQECQVNGQNEVCDLNTIETFKMQGVHIQDTTFLCGFTNLKFFEYDVYDGVEPADHDDIDISFVENYKNLESLRLNRHKFKNIGVINKLDKLDELIITGPSLEEHVDWKKDSPIEWLIVYNISQNGFNNILPLTNLKDLVLSITDSPVIDISTIDSFSKLQSISIWGEKPVDYKKYAKEEYQKERLKGYKNLYNIPLLREAEVFDCNVQFKFPKE